MKVFLKWFDNDSSKDGLIKAAIGHFWFVTIHPFGDGNGRVARAIADLALAQDEGSKIHCYSMTSQISKQRKQYYKILETTQKGNLDLTDWILWFLEVLSKSIENSESLIKKVRLINNFWKKNSEVELNPRQRKVLKKMLGAEPTGFVGGISNIKHVSIALICPATAKLDLAELEEKDVLKKWI